MGQMFYPILGELRYAWGLGIFGAPGRPSLSHLPVLLSPRGLPPDVSPEVESYHSVWSGHRRRGETHFTLEQAWRIWSAYALDQLELDLETTVSDDLEARLTLKALEGELSSRARRIRDLLDAIGDLVSDGSPEDVRLVIWYRSWLPVES